MPWKESNKVTERMRFISRYFEGERITDLAREFGISRQTGHALVKRYEEFGAQALRNRSSRPHHSPSRTPRARVEEVLKLKKRHPTWGPKKLKGRLELLQPDIRWPAVSTIGAILADEGLVKRRKRRRRASPSPTRRRDTQGSNELWCIDYKGQFRMGDRRYCYPLTVTDHFSRYILGCEALEDTKRAGAQMALWAAFARYGLPQAIRSDNGAPFASTGRLGLSRLSVQLMRLGIEIERIEPGHPEQNGRHERMHLTLKQDATRPPAANILAQQEKFDVFCKVFNEQRPHEALQMKTPGDVYMPSSRPLPKEPPAVNYPLHDSTCWVSRSGHFWMPGGGTAFLGEAFAQQLIGLRELQSGTWLVSFLDIDIAHPK
jgi:putative transposase